MTQALQRILSGKCLPRNEAAKVMRSILSQDLPSEQIAGLLTALRFRGETTDELSGFLGALRELAVSVNCPLKNAVDTCGTGGDGKGTFNISTAAAFIVAGAGVPVAKHGNRSVSSRTGSGDVLEALGVAIELPPEVAIRCLEEIGFCFFFAPLYHPTLAKVRPIRKALGIPTVFNFLGPLLNPARVKRQLLGVSQRALVAQFAELLRKEGSEEVMVVSGQEGLDEISLTGPTTVAHLRNGQISHYEIAPEDFGIARSHRPKLQGGDAKENAKLIESILTGTQSGDELNITLLNASATLVCSKVAADFTTGMELARESLKTGRALAVLQNLRRFR